MELTMLDFFCGAGGMGLGFKNAGWKIVGSWDWDKYAVQSYKANVEEHVQQADIREMKWDHLPKGSIWTFGFPCQDLSVAGQQKGMRLVCSECGHEYPLRESLNGACPECTSFNVAASTRSGLFFEVMRLLLETRKNAPDQLPAFIMAENVKGLAPYLGTVQREYERVGYVMSYQLYNSKYWGVPQSRERYYVVGIRSDLVDKISFSFPLQQTRYIPRLSSILEKDVLEKYYMSDEKAASVIQAINDKILSSIQETLPAVLDALQSVYTDKDGCAYCCDANYAKGTSAGDVGSGRRTQIIEVRPKGVIPCEYFPYYSQEEVATASETSPKYSDGPYLHPTINTILSNNDPILTEEDLAKYRREEPKIEVIGMLDIKAKDQSRRVYEPDGLAPTLTAVGGGHHEIKTFDRSAYRVRKLTPREYARLQGFPDTYRFVCSDTQLYRQFGNAVTVPVAEAIATALRVSLEAVKN